MFTTVKCCLTGAPIVGSYVSHQGLEPRSSPSCRNLPDMEGDALPIKLVRQLLND
jgi:hypothetical protein